MTITYRLHFTWTSVNATWEGGDPLSRKMLEKQFNEHINFRRQYGQILDPKDRVIPRESDEEFEIDHPKVFGVIMHPGEMHRHW